MKFEIVTRYLARLFIREARTAPAMMRLAADLSDKAGLVEWEPTAVNDFNVATSQVSPGYLMASPDLTWSVKVTGESLDVQVTQRYNLQTRTHVPVPSFDEYLSRVREIFDAGMGLVAAKPHRLAIVQGGVLASATDDAERMERVRKNLVNLPPFNGTPFEWNWRSAWKVTRPFGTASEPTNTVMMVRRSGVTFPEDAGDRLVVDLDINTDAVNATPRFSPVDVSAFVTASGTWHAQLARELSEYAGI